MPPRTQQLPEAARHAAWVRTETGREIRLARTNAAATTQRVAERLGWSKSKVSRIERGLIGTVALSDLALLAAVVGLRMSVKLYPAGVPLRDIGQVELLAALNDRMHRRWVTRHEVPMPRAGDLRAADQVSRIPGCAVMIEAYRNFADYQAQSRSARLKQADLGADRLVLLLEDTRRNRETLRAAGSEARRSFPVSQRAMLAALGAGRDPGGDGIVILRRARTGRVASRATNSERPAAPPAPVALAATQDV
jgi:transcriptional regulator with XRE-family HTH domain